MDQMAHTVINKRVVVLILFLFLSSNMFAQQQTEPAFIYKDLNNKSLSKLDYFLESFTPVTLKNCVFASGTFRFRITGKGKISNLEIKGNLPDTLVYSIKKRILETEKYWAYSNAIEASFLSKWFVVPVFVDVKETPNCERNKAIGENYLWLNQLFDKQNRIISTPTSYLLPPIYYFGMY